jgi:hypothetical protein
MIFYEIGTHIKILIIEYVEDKYGLIRTEYIFTLMCRTTLKISYKNMMLDNFNI